MQLKKKLFKRLEEKEERMVEIRRHLHENPKRRRTSSISMRIRM
ncbi:hypothetical protein [Salinicoccus roseus]